MGQAGVILAVVLLTPIALLIIVSVVLVVHHHCCREKPVSNNGQRTPEADIMFFESAVVPSTVGVLVDWGACAVPPEVAT